jgi:hypothetical protein
VSVPKKHHYLPQFYLRGFCPAGDLWLYDREKGKCHKSRPKAVAFRKGFYAAQGTDGELDYAEVEERLGVVERQAAPVIRKLDASGGVLELRERYALAMFVALLKYRTTAFERQSSEFNEVFADPVAAKEMMAPSVERVQALLEQAGYEDAGPSGMARMVYEHIQEHGVEHKPGPNARLEAMLQGTYKLGTELTLGPLTLARAPEGCRFITADDPYAVVARAGAQDPRTWEGANIIPPGHQSWIPLSGRSLLIAGYEELSGRYIQFDRAEAARRGTRGAQEDVGRSGFTRTRRRPTAARKPRGAGSRGWGEGIASRDQPCP